MTKPKDLFNLFSFHGKRAKANLIIIVLALLTFVSVSYVYFGSGDENFLSGFPFYFLPLLVVATILGLWRLLNS